MPEGETVVDWYTAYYFPMSYSIQKHSVQDRLAIVTLYRDASYPGGLPQIKDDLGNFVLRLNPVREGEGPKKDPKAGRVR